MTKEKKGKTMKVKIKGYLKNITDDEIITIDAKGIKNNSGISYTIDNVKHNIKFKKDILYLIRENHEFYNILIFNKNKIEESEYLIKEYNQSINLNIKTIDLEKDNDTILINYCIEETKVKYEYKIEIKVIK